MAGNVFAMQIKLLILLINEADGAFYGAAGSQLVLSRAQTQDGSREARRSGRRRLPDPCLWTATARKT